VQLREDGCAATGGRLCSYSGRVTVSYAAMKDAERKAYTSCKKDLTDRSKCSMPALARATHASRRTRPGLQV
jgi:hypothetical protein